MICNIRIIHVGPESNRSGKILPHAFVFPYAFLTLVNERGESVFFDLLLAVKTEKFFNLKFDGKTVRIPPCFSRDIVSLHRAVSRDHILYDTRQYMSDMRFAVCCRRSVIEHVSLCSLTDLQTLFENLVLGPELFDLLFTLHKSEVR